MSAGKNIIRTYRNIGISKEQYFELRESEIYD